MSRKFDECLKKKKIISFERAKKLVSKEIGQAKFDYGASQNSFKEGNFKWSTIQAYYSMFHSARALLYSKGFRERSHYCLVESIRALFVEKRLIDHKLVEALQFGKTLRENADYYGEFSKDAAEDMLESAKVFIDVVKKLLIST